MIDEVDEWMETVMGQMHGSVLPAQDLIMVDDGDGKIMSKTEVQVPRKKGAAWSRMTSRIDLERAYNGLMNELGTVARLYALFCIGVEPEEMAKDAHLNWPDAPKDEYGINRAILRGRAAWADQLENIGIRVGDKGDY